MMKIDGTVIKETKYIAGWVVVLSVMMQVAFFFLNRWDYTVLLGNILSGAASILNL